MKTLHNGIYLFDLVSKYPWGICYWKICWLKNEVRFYFKEKDIEEIKRVTNIWFNKNMEKDNIPLKLYFKENFYKLFIR